MKRWVFAICAVALVAMLSGCLTTTPKTAMIGAATPRVDGSESSHTGYGDPYAHAWSDDQARTLLWLRRNLPELWSDVPFPFMTFFSYNIHNDTREFGKPFQWRHYFADARDPSLQIRMMTLEARDRNEFRHQEVWKKQAAEAAAAEQAITGDVAELTDQEVSKKLEIVFP
jgi:hypothetical protein